MSLSTLLRRKIDAILLRGHGFRPKLSNFEERVRAVLVIKKCKKCVCTITLKFIVALYCSIGTPF